MQRRVEEKGLDGKEKQFSGFLVSVHTSIHYSSRTEVKRNLETSEAVLSVLEGSP